VRPAGGLLALTAMAIAAIAATMIAASAAGQGPQTGVRTGAAYRGVIARGHTRPGTRASVLLRR
jgi:hypothetical protein